MLSWGNFYLGFRLSQWLWVPVSIVGGLHVNLLPCLLYQVIKHSLSRFRHGFRVIKIAERGATIQRIVRWNAVASVHRSAFPFSFPCVFLLFSVPSAYGPNSAIFIRRRLIAQFTTSCTTEGGFRQVQHVRPTRALTEKRSVLVSWARECKTATSSMSENLCEGPLTFTEHCLRCVSHFSFLRESKRFSENIWDTA